MAPGPEVQVGPLGGVAFYAVLALIIIALVAGVTTGGMLLFIIAGAILVAGVFLLIQRVLRRITGGRR